jgi:hypothetical protein
VIARMWETKISPGQLDEFCDWVKATAWPQFVAAPGFGGGVVLVTRWATAAALAGGNEWFDLGAERFLAREPQAWDFSPVALD